MLPLQNAGVPYNIHPDSSAPASVKVSWLDFRITSTWQHNCVCKEKHIGGYLSYYVQKYQFVFFYAALGTFGKQSGGLSWGVGPLWPDMFMVIYTTKEPKLEAEIYANS